MLNVDERSSLHALVWKREINAVYAAWERRVREKRGGEMEKVAHQPLPLQTHRKRRTAPALDQRHTPCLPTLAAQAVGFIAGQQARIAKGATASRVSQSSPIQRRERAMGSCTSCKECCCLRAGSCRRFHQRLRSPQGRAISVQASRGACTKRCRARGSGFCGRFRGWRALRMLSRMT